MPSRILSMLCRASSIRPVMLPVASRAMAKHGFTAVASGGNGGLKPACAGKAGRATVAGGNGGPDRSAGGDGLACGAPPRRKIDSIAFVLSLIASQLESPAEARPDSAAQPQLDRPRHSNP